MATFKDRLIKEELELTTKLTGLQIFLKKQGFKQTISDFQLDLLYEQEYHMDEYAKILRTRIADIEEKGDE